MSPLCYWVSRDWVVLGGVRSGGDVGHFWDLGDFAFWFGVRLTPWAQACRVAIKTSAFPSSLPNLINSALWA